MALKMLLILLFVAIAFGAGLVAADATFFADLDSTYVNPTFQKKYNATLDGSDVLLNCRNNSGGNCDRPVCRDWEDGVEGTTDSSHEFDDRCYFTVAGDDSECTTDIDACDQKGYSILATINPDRPNNGDTDWLLSFGNAVTKTFGIKMGFQNAQVILHAISSTRIWKIECKIPDDFLDPDTWYTLAAVRGPNPGGEPRLFVNGTRLDDCIYHANKTQTPNIVFEKNADVVVGAAIEKEQVLEGFQGRTEEICFFPRPVTLVEQRCARKRGCSHIPDDCVGV